MQTIRIILSAAKSLQQEKLELADLVENLNHSLESRNANILMLVWDGSEAERNDFKEKISDTDLCLTLYYDTFDESTQSELETAYQSLCEGKNPKKIYVYFKEGETVPEQLQEFRDSFPTKYGHFYCSFSNIDTLKADFLLQFMEYQSKNLGSSKMLEVNNGKVTVDGKEYVDLKNVPFAGNNEEYNLLLKSIKKTQKLLTITDEDDPDYADYAADLQEMKEKLAKMESSLWDTALLITRLSTTKCSERLKRAMDLFNQGDNKGAQAVLNEEEIERDVEHNLHLIQLGEEGKKGLETNIDEYLLKIQTYENEMEEGWVDKVTSLYEKCIELGRNRIDDSKYANMISNYADFLFNQHQYNKVEAIYREAVSLYRKLSLSDDIDYEPCIVYCLTQLSLYYIHSNEFQKAENALKEILLIQKEDGDEGERYRHAIALSRLAYLHYNQLHYKNALEECEKTISILSHYVSQFDDYYDELNDSLYLRGVIHKAMGQYDLAEKDALEMLEYAKQYHLEESFYKAYNLLGNVYESQLKFSLAIDVHQKAIDILEEKARNNPLPYLQVIAGEYVNLGNMHRFTNMYDVAYNNYNKARAILRNLVNHDPLHNSEYYITCLYQLSNLCKETKQYSEAEEYIEEAINHSRRLTETDAERHLFDLAHSLNVKGIIQYEQSKYKEAEKSYLESLQIRRKIVSDFGEEYIERIAQILSNLGLLHCSMKKYEDAEKDYLEAVAIYKKIISEEGFWRGGDIALTYLNLGYLNRCTKNWEKAIDYYQESINLFNNFLEEGIVREKVQVFLSLSRNYVGIGYSHKALKQFEKALTCFKKAAEVIEEHLNEENKIVFASDYSSALNEYAWSLYEMNDFVNAEPIATKAVETIRLLPKLKNRLRMCLDTLSCIHRGLGKYKKAEKSFLESLKIAEELYAQDPVFNLACLYNELKELSFLYYEMRDSDKFNQFKTKALHFHKELNEEVKKGCEKDFRKLESLVL